MGVRREARERAVQFLYQHDLNSPADLEAELGHFWRSQQVVLEDRKHVGPVTPAEPAPPTAHEAAVRLFADPLIKGALEHRDESDQIIQKFAQNWSLRRIAAVDRNVLRLAIYEMFHREDIPPVVSINEAVDIAKKFSTEDSGKFVNGLLDRIKQDVMRPARTTR